MFVSQRQERLLGVLQRAHDASLLMEDYYKSWVRRSTAVFLPPKEGHFQPNYDELPCYQNLDHKGGEKKL